VLSSDAFREILTGDAADQSATKTAFSIIHREVVKRLAAGRTVAVDATNVERHARRALLARAAAAGVPTIGIVFALPDGIVLGRNAARAGRVVLPEIVQRHQALLAAALPSLADEGFTRLVVLRSDAEVASVEISRAAGTGSTERT
jgi:protein phosphatase